MTVRVGVIGCGFFARFHIAAWRDLGSAGVDLVAVCDIDAQKAERTAAEFGVPRWYADAAEMFAKEQLGLVDIATRMTTHRDLVGLAIASRVPISLQKPLAPDWRQAVEIVRMADAANLFFAVHENFRFQAPMIEARRLISEGAIGEPSWARISFRTGDDVYANQPYFADEERLLILDLGIHMLDLARFLIGEVAHVSCETQRRTSRPRAEDTATMLLRHVSGAVSVAEGTYESRRLPSSGVQTMLEVEGPRGAIAIDRDFRLSLTSDGRLTTRSVAPPALGWATPGLHVVQDSVVRTCAHILAALKDGTEPSVSGHDNLKTFALVEAAYRAASERRAVAPETYAEGVTG